MKNKKTKIKKAKKVEKVEPRNDKEYEDALEKEGYEVIDHDVNDFSVRRKTTGSTTGLEAEDYSSALCEAWALVKP